MDKQINFTDFPEGYMCVCGSTFKHPMERTIHSASCESWRDHNLGVEILKKFPQDKYGGYVIAAPAVFVAFIRDAIREEALRENRGSRK